MSHYRHEGSKIFYITSEFRILSLNKFNSLNFWKTFKKIIVAVDLLDPFNYYTFRMSMFILSIPVLFMDPFIHGEYKNLVRGIVYAIHTG